MTVRIVKNNTSHIIKDIARGASVILQGQKITIKTYKEMTEPTPVYTTAKGLASAFAGSVAAFLEPLTAPATVCTVFVLADFGTALSLGRRLRRAGRKCDCRLSSRRFGHMVLTLVKIYAALVVASMTQQWIICGYGGFDAVRFTAGAVCLWQLLSILENESTCSGARWARIARKFLVNKARRHLGEELDGFS